MGTLYISTPHLILLPFATGMYLSHSPLRPTQGSEKNLEMRLDSQNTTQVIELSIGLLQCSTVLSDLVMRAK